MQTVRSEPTEQIPSKLLLVSDKYPNTLSTSNGNVHQFNTIILTLLCKILLSLFFSNFHIVGFCPLFRLWDFVLWDFVLWDFVRRDYVLWDFVLWDSVPDSSETCQNISGHPCMVIRRTRPFFCNLQLGLLKLQEDTSHADIDQDDNTMLINY